METKQSNNSATPMADAVKIANQRALFSLEWENDTVFKKRELNYKTKAAFQKDLEAGKISKYTTVFIKDSKEIYKNGQYYGTGSSSIVDISDIIGRLNKIEDGKKVEQSDYDNLKKYISDGKILICNSLEERITVSYNVSYYCHGNDIIISANAPYVMGILYSGLLINGNDLSISKSESALPFFEHVSECNLSKNYKKSDSYTSITSSDSIEKAIGKLEANVSKIITNGNGSKYLSDNGEYKELTSSNSGMPYFDLSSFSEESGDVSDELLNSIKNVGLSNLESISISFYNKAITYIGELRFSSGNYSISGVSISEEATDYLINSINISISSDLKVYSLSRFNQEIKKSGLGDKFLSDDGTYKEVKSDSSNQNLINDDLSKLLTYIAEKESFTQSDISQINELIKNLSYKNGYFNGKASVLGEFGNYDASFNIQYTNSENFIVEMTSVGSLTTAYQQISLNNIRIVVKNNTIESDSNNIGFAIEKGHIVMTAKGEIANDTSIDIKTSGDGTKYLSDDGTYKEVKSSNSIILEDIDVIKIVTEGTGSTIEHNLTKTTYNDVLNALKSNSNVFIKCQYGNANMMFNMIDWVMSENNGAIFIDFDVSIISSLGIGSMMSNKIEIQIYTNDKYKAIVNSFIITNQDKDILLTSSTNDGNQGASIKLETSGDGAKYLANNGKYKEINSYYKLTDKFYQLTNKSTSDDIKNAIGGDSGFESLKSAIKSHTRIFCEFNNGSIEYCGELQCSYTNMQEAGEIIAISMLGYAPFAVNNSAASCATLIKMNNEYTFQTGIMGGVS